MSGESTSITAVDAPHPRRRELELAVLNDIACILSERSGQRETLQTILDLLDERLEMRRGILMLLSSNGQELFIEAAKGLAPSRHETRYRKGEGITGRVLKTGRPIIVPRIADETEFKGRIQTRGRSVSGAWGFICVPVSAGAEVVGTLSVDVPCGPAARLESDQRLLSIVAHLVAYDVKARRTAEVERYALTQENLRLRGALGERFRPENIIGNTNVMRTVYERIHQVAPSGSTVLIRGESGTGKELVASAIHYMSARADKPFVKVHCAALNENLLESELFGHEKGAFTGASRTRIGSIEEAEGGTLFFDEIGEFSPMIQVKLLRVLQEREFQRVGSSKPRKADVRIVAATNKDLEDAVRRGEFRQDLYYRINVFPIFLPALRERKDDILLLADHFTRKYAQESGKNVSRISTTAIDMMMAYHWPGNIRELENCIEYAMLLTTDDAIHGRHLPPSLQLPAEGHDPLAESLTEQVNQLERDLITDAMKRTSGNVRKTAELLCITERVLRYKISKLGIKRPSHFNLDLK